MSSRATTVRALMPPALWSFGKRRLPWLVRAMGGHFTHIKFSGDYPDFASARAQCTGYDDASILAQTREALLKVKSGEFKWEQDGMVSNSDYMPWPLLAVLLKISAQKDSHDLRVLDFGGALGSQYFQCHHYLPARLNVTWHIVEQKSHVDVGRADFQDDHLKFDYTVQDVLQQGRPDVLLLSSVLPYLSDPEKFLRELPSWGIPHLIIDRTPLWDHDRHRLTLQEVPPEIYKAIYPAWFLSKKKIFSLIEPHYRLDHEVPSDESWEIDDEVVPFSQLQFSRHTA